MRALIAFAAAALLAACAAPAPQSTLGGQAAGGGVIVAGTLAVNDCELLTAPHLTNVDIAARTAAVRLRAGELPVATAEQILAAGRAAHADLVAACRGGRLDPALLARGRTNAERMRALLP